MGQYEEPSRNEHRCENCLAGPSTKSFFSFWFVFVFAFITISRGYQDLWTRNIVPHQKREEDQKTFGFRSSGGKNYFKIFLFFFLHRMKSIESLLRRFSPRPPFRLFLMAVASFLLFKHLWGCLNRKLTLVWCPAQPLLAVPASSTD